MQAGHQECILSKFIIKGNIFNQYYKCCDSDLLKEPYLLNDGALKNGFVLPLEGSKLTDNGSEYDNRYMFYVFIARKPFTDLTNVVFPLFFIGLLAGLAPLIRINGGERISFIITTQLGNILMLTIVEENTSSSISGEKPRIIDFYTIVQICCLHSLIGSAQTSIL